MTVIVDGKKIRDEIRDELKKQIKKIGRLIHLELVYVGEDPVIEKFINLKEKFGESVGVQVSVHQVPKESGEEEIIEKIKGIVEGKPDGIVVQLPLPNTVSAQRILDTVPTFLDVDLLSGISKESFRRGDLSVLPPVVGAIKEICDRYDVSLKEKNIVVIGKGLLVGAPIKKWLDLEGYSVMCLEKGDNLEASLKNADVIISGAGVSKLVLSKYIKEGVVLIDVGTSETNGRIEGDIDPECKEKASLFSPVPGGAGPITVAMLFKNLVTLSQK